MTRRPSGSPPPTAVTLDERRIELAPLLEAIADRYFAEFPGDLERYGTVARDWELHDTAHCLNWAALDVKGFASLDRNIALAGEHPARAGLPGRAARAQPRARRRRLRRRAQRRGGRAPAQRGLPVRSDGG